MKPGIFIKRIILIGVALVIVSCNASKDKPDLESATLLPVGKKLTNFSLIHYGQGEFNLDSIKDGWSLFFFGYTRCPDVCPTELLMLAEMMRIIERNPTSVVAIPQVIFVSVDPQQDIPKALQEYASYYHASFKGVTGKQEDVDRFANEMSAFYERVYHLNGQALKLDPNAEIPKELENSYLINHTTTIILTNPKGEMHAVFFTPHEPEVMVRDLAAIQRFWQ